MGNCVTSEGHASHIYEVKGNSNGAHHVSDVSMTQHPGHMHHITPPSPPPPWTPPPPPAQNYGIDTQRAMTGVKDRALIVPIEKKPAVRPPATLAIIPATPTSPTKTSTTESSIVDGRLQTDTEPSQFHFELESSHTESGTDSLAVTPDLLRNPSFAAVAAALQTRAPSTAVAQRHGSSASRQSCDTISNKSELSRCGSGDSQIEVAIHEVISRSHSSPVANSNASAASGSTQQSAETGLSVPNSLSNRSTASNELFRRLSVSGHEAMPATNEVVMRKDYMKSRLTVRQDSNERTLPRDVLQWKRGNILGRGSFGTVYLGLTDTGELIAVKQMEVSQVSERELRAEYQKIYREVEILKHLKHRHIVGYLGSSFEGHTISIFTHYVSGGSLSNLLHQFGPLGEGIAAKYTKQLLNAIAYLHENKVVHRDIKSGNIMLTPEGVLKLIDFGCARKLALRVSMSGSHMMRSWKGTPYWMAPEVIHESGHGKKSDIWSLGCTVFEMLTGIPPWGDREPITAIYAIGCDDIPMPKLNESFSVHAREFVDRCLIKDKFKRPSATALQLHSFVFPAPERQLSDTWSEESKWVESV